MSVELIGMSVKLFAKHFLVAGFSRVRFCELFIICILKIVLSIKWLIFNSLTQEFIIDYSITTARKNDLTTAMVKK